MDDSTDTKKLPKSNLKELYEYVDKNRENMAEFLNEAVAVSSLSRDEKYFPNITKMLEVCQRKMEELGATTELVDCKNSKTANGSFYPPILFGNLFVDEEYKTVCVYGHVDTSATGEEAENGKIQGAASSRGKGALFCWLNALKIYSAAQIDIPINVKFIVEGAAELHSPTLHDAISKKNDFFLDVDYTCLAVDKKIQQIPCLRYGYRGLCHFSLVIHCGQSDIDAATYGGAFDQPLVDAVRVVSSLMDKHEKLAIPNVSRDVAVPSLREKKLIEKMELNVEDTKKKIGVKRLRHKEIASRIISHGTRLPSISIHGFETSTDHSRPKNLSMIPCRTVVKFSIRLSKDQKVREIRSNVENHVKQLWNRYKCVNDFKLDMDVGVDPWIEDPTNGHYKAAAEAVKSVYGKTPLYVYDGRSLAAASIFKSAYPHSNALVLSLGEPDDSSGKDESFYIENYLKSVKIIMSYMCLLHES